MDDSARLVIDERTDCSIPSGIQLYHSFTRLLGRADKKHAATACISVLAKNNLELSEEDAYALLSDRDEHLSRVQRIERGAGVLPDLALEFADSSYLDQRHLVDQLSCLQEAFYSVIDDAPSYVPDDEILIALRRAFDGFAGGDAEILSEMDVRSVLDLLDSEPADGIYDATLQYSNSQDGGLLGDDSEWADRAKGESCGWSEETTGVYRIADGSGRVYTFDPSEWHDDVILPDWSRVKCDDDPIASYRKSFFEGCDTYAE